MNDQSHSPAQSAAEVLFEQRGAAGLITLNRPKALNAVSHDMVLAMRRQLDDWAQEPSITRIVLMASEGKAFSAGGDVRKMYDLGKAGRLKEALQFWRDEYPLNVAIKNYKKPYISLIDGICMGGGVGISLPGSHRVAGDRYSFAMPEVSIGFFPDVGATWFLPRMPGELGTYCALTGERFNIADALYAGVATHRVPSAKMPALLEDLTTHTPVDDTLAAFAEPGGEGPIAARRHAIDHIFAGNSVEVILERLDHEAATNSADAEWAGKTAALIRLKSPTSLKLSLAQVRFGAMHDFETCMRLEMRIVTRIVEATDFYEGVRAVLVDKDNKPTWNPKTLSEVTNAEIDRYFASLDGGELALP